MSRSSSGRGSFGGGIAWLRSLRTAISSFSACCATLSGPIFSKSRPPASSAPLWQSVQ